MLDRASEPPRPRTRKKDRSPIRRELADRVRPPGGRRPEPAGLRRGRLGRRSRADRHRSATSRTPTSTSSADSGQAARLVPSLGPRWPRRRPATRRPTPPASSTFLRDGCPGPGRGRIRGPRAPVVALVEDQARPAAQGRTALEGWVVHRHHRARRAVRHPVGGRARGRHARARRAPPAGAPEAAARPGPRSVGGAARRGARRRHHRGREEGRDRRQHVGRRGPAHRTGPRATVRATCRSPRSRQTAGSATCSPVPKTDAASPLPTPDGFAGELRPYQERGLGLAGLPRRPRSRGLPGRRHGARQDGPAPRPAGRRAGRALSRHRSRRRALRTGRRRDPTGPDAGLCPMSLVGNWQREAARFAPKLSVYVHHGPDRLDGKAFTRHAEQGGPGAVDLRSRRA